MGCGDWDEERIWTGPKGIKLKRPPNDDEMDEMICDQIVRAHEDLARLEKRLREHREKVRMGNRATG